MFSVRRFPGDFKADDYDEGGAGVRQCVYGIGDESHAPDRQSEDQLHREHQEVQYDADPAFEQAVSQPDLEIIDIPIVRDSLRNQPMCDLFHLDNSSLEHTIQQNEAKGEKRKPRGKTPVSYSLRKKIRLCMIWDIMLPKRIGRNRPMKIEEKKNEGEKEYSLHHGTR